MTVRPLSIVVLLVATALAACNSASSRDEEAAAAAVAHRENAAQAAAAGAAAQATATGAATGVTGFDILDNQGGPTGRWTEIGPSLWNSHNLSSGEQGQVPESGRSACCIMFAIPNGETWTANFESMQLSGAFGSFPIANVVR